MTEAVHLHVRKAGLGDVFLDTSPDLGMAHRDVLGLEPGTAGEAVFSLPRQGSQERLHRLDDRVVADRVLGLRRSNRLAFAPSVAGYAALDVEDVAADEPSVDLKVALLHPIFGTLLAQVIGSFPDNKKSL